MPQLDFKEIPQANLASGDQDTFEMFAREFLELIGYKVLSGPDRGTDLGRDLIVLETRSGVGGETSVRWLVSCKHKAHSGQSVGLSDEQDISDRVKAHSCAGFIGFYSTIPGSSLTQKLEGIKKATPSFEYQFFDRERIEHNLYSKSAGLAIAQRYFPVSGANSNQQMLTIEETKLIVKDVVQDVFEKNFIRLQTAAQEEAQRRVELLTKQISELASNSLRVDELERLSEPDVQYALFEAVKVGARNDSQSLRDTLASLVNERIKNDVHDLKRIVYSEAISTIGKLTRNQLDILALHFVTEQQVSQLGEVVLDWQRFLDDLESLVNPFIVCTVSYADIRHLQYSSCAYTSADRHSISKELRIYLPLLFQSPIPKKQIDALKLPEDVTGKFFSLLPLEQEGDEPQYVFIDGGSETLDQQYSEYMLKLYHGEELSSEQIIKVRRLLGKTVLPERKVGKRIPETIKQLEGHWQRGLRRLSLTTVGLVLATCHIEQTLGVKYDVSDWFE